MKRSRPPHRVRLLATCLFVLAVLKCPTIASATQRPHGAINDLTGLPVPQRNSTVVTTSPAQAGGTIYVDVGATGANSGESWTDAYTHLQGGLAAAIPGDEIWVAAGVYTGTFRLKDSVAVYGGFAGTEIRREQRDWQTHTTVLSGDVDGDDLTDSNGVVTRWADIRGSNADHVVIGSGTGPTAVLDGFTITAGRSVQYGGGMVNSGGSPTLANITFSGNCAFERGGGAYNSGGSPTLTNVTFTGNHAYADGPNGNGGGGMYNSYSDPVLINVTFSGNSSGLNGGGMYNFYGDPVLINVAFSGNSAYSNGGGMYDYYNSPVLINATFSGNRAGHDVIFGGGGGMYVNHSTPTLTNCILWGNTAPTLAQMYVTVGSSPTVTYSDVQGGYPGTGNIDANPQFASGLRLRDDSPAIDAGDNGAVPPDVYDLDRDGDTAEPLPYDRAGNPRFGEHPRPDTGAGSAPLVDMGAYECVVLSLHKTADPIVLEPGDVLTYTLSFNNASTMVITNVLLIDAIPTHLHNPTYVHSGAHITSTGEISYTWDVEDLSPGEGGIITITGVLSTNLLPGRSGANVATLSGMAGSVPVVSTASATVARFGADLAVAKSVARDPVVAGERLTYTLTITNHGLFDSSDIVLTDTLPGEVAFVSASPGCNPVGGGNAAGSTAVTCALGVLANQATTAFTIAVTVPVTGGQITNTALVAGTAPDPDPANDVATEATWVSAEADLALAKTGRPDPVLAGGLLTYTLVFTNHGPDYAGGVVLTDTLPAGATYGGRLLALHLDEPEGATHFEDASGFGHHGFCVQEDGTCPEAGGRGFLYGYYASFDGIDDWIEGEDFDIDNDFTILFWVYPDTTDDQQAFIGKHTADGDNLLVFGFWSGGYCVNLRNSTYQGGPKAVGWQHLAVVGRQTGPSTTEVTVYRDGQPLWQHELGAVVGDITGKGWVIGQDWDSATLGTDFFQGAMDEVTIFNRALSASQIAAIYADHPTFPPVVSQGTCALGDALACELGSPPPGAIITVTLPVHLSATQGGTLTNTATVAGYVPDPCSCNSTATETTSVGAIDLALGKMASSAALFEGDIVTYAVSLSNRGPATAMDVVVSDTLPAGITFGGYAAPLGTYSDATGAWQVGTIAAGDATTLTIAGTVRAGTAGQSLVNRAVLSASNPADIFAHNNTGSATVTVVSADLSVSKRVDAGALPAASLGDGVTYTVAIGNDGDGIAAGVVVTDPLPSGVTFDAWVKQGLATVDAPSQTIEWGPHDVAAHSAYTVSFTANITRSPDFSGRTITNTAYATAASAGAAQDSVSFPIWFPVYLPLLHRNQ
jgi:uncharacterized repeat protein (TIGR01451 family)